MPKLWKRYNRLHNLTLRVCDAGCSDRFGHYCRHADCGVNAVFTSIGSILTNAAG